VYRASDTTPVATTVQSCKVTWHVWEEAYRIEVMDPSGTQTRWTTTVEGVLRRCAEARELLAANRSQLEPGVRVFVRAKVQVNPVNPMLLEKIKRWVSRPTGTGTAAPGDALFGTFTGLFLQRIGEAERELDFVSPPVVPTVKPQPPKA
jgi:hypothetical protein